MVRKNLNEIRDSGINLFIGINLNFFFFFQMYQRVIYISEIVYTFLYCFLLSVFFKQMKIEDSMGYFTMHKIVSFCYIINVAYVYGYAFGTCLIDFSFF